MPGPCDANPEFFLASPAQPENGSPFNVVSGPEMTCPQAVPAAPSERANADASSVRTLLEAMGRGERQAAAEFVIRYGPQIRRRVRGKLRVSMRRLFDSQDILSTLGRRLDGYVHKGNFEARSEGELWSLVFTIAERSVAEKARIWEALAEKESGLARASAAQGDALTATIENGPDSEFEQLLGCIPVDEDRQIARLWSMGKTSELIAADVGMTPEQVRKRWSRTRDRLRERFQEQLG